MLYGGSVDLFQTSQRIFLNFEIHIDGSKSNNNTACNFILGESRLVPTSSFGLENVSKDTAFKLGIDSQEKLIV
jgi:uncharacterized protein YjfI (DUF2170 family)